MKLMYRGVCYDYDPSGRSPYAGSVHADSISPAPYTLIYRGQKIQVDPTAPPAAPVQNPDRPDFHLLRYRGAIYRVARYEEGAATAAQPTAPFPLVKVQIPSTLPRHYISKVHRANLVDNLQRRMKVAKARGDEKLLKLLESEREQLHV
ncbi:MAG: DUF4278 domain-containing protein [Oculatellaceae cyanobacterium Prado106]|jgi:hypothetical protein|nr:DUF4278 domain-containing protein [Oculatellaceae cyanobacterium Prado106]